MGNVTRRKYTIEVINNRLALTPHKCPHPHPTKRKFHISYGHLNIAVKFPTKWYVNYKLPPTATVLDLKKEIYIASKIPVKNQRLHLLDKSVTMLNNNMLIKSYHIIGKDVLLSIV